MRFCLFTFVLSGSLAMSLFAAMPTRLDQGFEQNTGQFQPGIRYGLQRQDLNAAFRPGGRTALMWRDSPTIDIEFVGARQTEPQPGTPRGAVARYYSGPGARLIEGRQFETIRYPQLYPGVDVMFHQARGSLEFDLSAERARDLQAVRWQVSGAEVRLSASGDVEVINAGGILVQHRPQAYQVLGGHHVGITAEYVVNSQTITLRLGPHDPDAYTVIDPAVYVVSYAGGTSSDAIYGLATDASGNIYATGESSSSSLLGQPGVRQGLDAFLARLSSDGTSVQWITYLSGSGRDAGMHLAVDTSGGAVVAGRTASTNFPATGSAYQRTSGGSEDAFVARFNASGTLQYATYLGGFGQDLALTVGVNLSGAAYVAGQTVASNFPTTAGAIRSTFAGGISDCFISVISPDGSTLQFSTYYGGNGTDVCKDLAVASDGSVWVTGTSDGGLALTGALYGSVAGQSDAFISRISVTGGGVLFGTYLGGSSRDEGNAITLQGGQVIVGGQTLSSDLPVTTGAYQAVNRGNLDGFVLFMNASSPSVGYLTYLGGSGQDVVTGVSRSAVSGRTWVTGYTASPDFPSVQARQATLAGQNDAFIVALESNGTVSNATFLGGLGDDRSLASALDASEKLVIGGTTTSPNLPVTGNAPQTTLGGGADGWFSASRPNNPPTLTSITPTGATGTGTTFTVTASDLDGASDLSQVRLLIGSSTAQTSSCVVIYSVPNNTLSLLADNGTTSAGLIVPGSSSTLSNSQCTLRGTGSSATPSGNTVTVGINLQFTAAFGGSRNVYGSAVDASGGTDPYRQITTYNVFFNVAPAIVSLSPTAAPTTGAFNQVFTYTVSDGNGFADVRAARFLINATQSATGACLVTYDNQLNQFSLVADSGTGNVGTNPAGGGTDLSNTQCTLVAAGSNSARSGNNVTLTISLRFLDPFRGNRNIYGQVEDSIGQLDGYRSLGTWNLPLNQTPRAVSITPASGTGVSQTFTISAADDDGNADINFVRFIANSAAAVANGCVVIYTSSTNLFTLMRDDGVTPQGTVSPASATVVSNSQCTLTGTQSTVARSGINLTLALQLTFSGAFRGTTRNSYVQVEDRGGAIDGYRQLGTWTIPTNQTPVASSISPASGTAASQVFTVVATDADGNADFAFVSMLVNVTNSPVNGCVVTFNAQANTFTVLDDAGVNAAGTVAAGSSTTAQNTFCQVNGAGSGSTRSGTTLTTTFSITFLASRGPRNTYIRAEDRSGAFDGYKQVGTWTNTANNVAPTTTSIAPTGGSGDATFTLTASDGNTAWDIRYVRFLVNTSTALTSACYVTYDAYRNMLLLADNSGVVPASGPAPGAAASDVSNGACTIRAAQSSVSRSGNNLTVNLGIQFVAGTFGTRNLYLQAEDYAGAVTAWTQYGTWLVTNGNAPIFTVSPSTGNSRNVQFYLVVTDPQGADTIRTVRFLMGPSLDATRGCLVQFDNQTNNFYLYADNGITLLGPTPPAYPVNLTNTRCTLVGWLGTATRSGNDLSLRVQLQLKTTLVGAQILYMQADDVNSNLTGWTALGTWTLP